MREIAQFTIIPGSESAFATAVSEAVPLFESAEGFRGLEFGRCHERLDQFWLLVEWAQLEDHVVTFRQSPAFAKWRQLVGHLFAGPPHVVHAQMTSLSTDAATGRLR